jgi:penicillin-binding protein 1A
VKAAGKTGTTNAHRDAWFVGYTGNFVCGVWFGNDDYHPMTQMTGGSLPAMTWREIMVFAHQGLELKPIPGLGPTGGRTFVAESKRDGSDGSGRPSALTRRGADALVRLERLLDEATRALAARTVPSREGAQAPTTTQPGTLASVSDEGSTGQSQGN